MVNERLTAVNHLKRLAVHRKKAVLFLVNERNIWTFNKNELGSWNW